MKYLNVILLSTVFSMNVCFAAAGGGRSDEAFTTSKKKGQIRNVTTAQEFNNEAKAVELAHTSYTHKRYTDAIKQYTSVLATQRLGQEVKEKCLLNLALSNIYQGCIYYNGGFHENAEDILDAALKYWKKGFSIKKDNGSHILSPETIENYTKLFRIAQNTKTGHVFFRTGNYAHAKRQYTHALDILEVTNSSERFLFSIDGTKKKGIDSLKKWLTACNIELQRSDVISVDTGAPYEQRNAPQKLDQRLREFFA